MYSDDFFVLVVNKGRMVDIIVYVEEELFKRVPNWLPAIVNPTQEKQFQ